MNIMLKKLLEKITNNVISPNQMPAQTQKSKTLSVLILFFFALLFTVLAINQKQSQIQSAQATSSSILPTFYCMGGVPCVSPVPTDIPGATKAAAPFSTDPCVPITQPPQPTAQPTEIPAYQQADTQDYQHPKHKKKKHKKEKKDGFIELLMQLLLQIMQLIINTLINEQNKPTPVPTQTPCVSTVPVETITPIISPIISVQATPSPTIPVTTTPAASTSGTVTNVPITFYGSYDNDPQGSLGIAHPVIHQEAGGTGTYQDPLTFASPAGTGEYAWGTVIYVPEVQKYFIREDECAVSWTAPSGCGPVSHVDLYVGNPSADQSVLNCESALTPSGGTGQIIVDPPADLTVDPNPIWNETAKTCMTPHL